MRHETKKGERGIAIVAAILLLALLSAMAFGLVFMTNTESLVNSNLRQEETAIFAARAGVEEARNRMMAADANSIFSQLPTAAPTAAGGNILYIINPGSAAASTITPWTLSTSTTDDELCHDGYTITGLQAQSTVSPGIRCTTVPSGTLTTVSSTAPWSGTSAALPYKWVRIAMKTNSSVQSYSVNGSAAATTPICWTGTYEVPLSGANCQAMTPSANPVYLVTALAVTSTGARKMIQTEVALNPAQPLPYGLFATGTGCGVISTVGVPSTDSYTSANGGTYSSNHSNTGGDIGSNGNINLSSGTTVGGSIGMPQDPVSVGACPGSGLTTGASGPYYNMVSNPANQLMPNNGTGGVITMPTPAAPVPAPPNTTYNPGSSMVPGTYGNISLSGHSTLTIAPGTYNINSFSMNGNSTIQISPPGQVVFNVAGTGQSTPFDSSGGNVVNPSGIAENFQVNYAGTGSIVLGGGTQNYMVVNAPNASVSFHGNADFYGAVVANTITMNGNTSFHFDRASALAPQSNGYYTLISLRDVSY